MEIVNPDTVSQAQENADQVNTRHDGYESLSGLKAEVHEMMPGSSDIRDLKTSASDGNNEVTVTDEQRDAFVSSIISGGRYREHFKLFGNIDVVIRCRSTDESDAIMAYIKHQALTGKLKNDYDYTSFMRMAMIAAQVEELAGVKYSEFKDPMYLTESGDKLEEPEWIKTVDMWRNKPAAVTLALGKVIGEFEARYWKMIEASEDINFWEHAGSTEP